MKTAFDLDKIIKRGKLISELELEQAYEVDKSLRLMEKDDKSLSEKRKVLRAIIRTYEQTNWSEKNDITDEQFSESDIAEMIVRKERIFNERRKQIIRKKLKENGLNQQQLGELLGHFSKSYMSELMNGICPFSLRDLVIIHRVLEIELVDLIPVIINQKDRLQIKSFIEKQQNTKIKFSKKTLERL